jgi:hypothetical protein
MPNAKIIDARRYPLDCCFSMFKQLFAQGQEFSYGLAEAGSYYNNYVKLMNHWNGVLPDKILRVNNEDIIEDLEGQVKECLNFWSYLMKKNAFHFMKRIDWLGQLALNRSEDQSTKTEWSVGSLIQNT